MKRILLVCFFGVLILASALNLFSFQRSIVTNDGGREFNIGKFVELNRFDESAPVVLSTNFRKVSVKRVGDPKKNGVSFSRELTRIFGVKQITDDVPYDIRGRSEFAKLVPFINYSAKAGCAAEQKTKQCDLLLVWDDRNSSPFRTFITFRVGDSTFAMVDSNLAKNVLKVTKW